VNFIPDWDEHEDLIDLFFFGYDNFLHATSNGLAINQVDADTVFVRFNHAGDGVFIDLDPGEVINHDDFIYH
jgi:hypothetical protein